jgi:hypothetical protein
VLISNNGYALHIVSDRTGRALCGLRIHPHDLYQSEEASQRVWDDKRLPHCDRCTKHNEGRR